MEKEEADEHTISEINKLQEEILYYNNNYLIKKNGMHEERLLKELDKLLINSEFEIKHDSSKSLSNKISYNDITDTSKNFEIKE